ncbi:MAG TPA: response regulator [Terriglobia bacterium]|nr:response regulator [Terriglobia bacterium]
MIISLKNLTILIVDDDADTCHLLRSVLEEAGACVLVARSVSAALDTFRRSPPHAVVADIQLGDSDGYALIKAIRQHNIEYRGFTLAIAVTGFACPEDEERAMAAGFDVYLRKPIDLTGVVDTIAEVLHRPDELAA